MSTLDYVGNDTWQFGRDARAVFRPRASGELDSVSEVGSGRQEALLVSFRERLADWAVCEARTIAAWAETGLCTEEFVASSARAEAVLRDTHEHERQARQAAAVELTKERAARRRDALAANARARMEAKARAAQRAMERQAQGSDTQRTQRQPRRPLLSRPQPAAHQQVPGKRSARPLSTASPLQGMPSTKCDERRPQPPMTPRPPQPVARCVHFSEPCDHHHNGSYTSYNSSSNSTRRDGGESADARHNGYFDTEATLPAATAAAVTGQRAPITTSTATTSSSTDSSFASASVGSDRGPSPSPPPGEAAEGVAAEGSSTALVFARARKSGWYTPSAANRAEAVPPRTRGHRPGEGRLAPPPQPRRDIEGTHSSTPEKLFRQDPRNTDSDEDSTPQAQDTTNVFRSSSRGNGAGESSTSRSPPRSFRRGSTERSTPAHAGQPSTPVCCAAPQPQQQPKGKGEESALQLSPITARGEEVDDLSSAGSYLE